RRIVTAGFVGSIHIDHVQPGRTVRPILLGDRHGIEVRGLAALNVNGRVDLHDAQVSREECVVSRCCARGAILLTTHCLLLTCKRRGLFSSNCKYESFSRVNSASRAWDTGAPSPKSTLRESTWLPFFRNS